MYIYIYVSCIRNCVSVDSLLQSCKRIRDTGTGTEWEMEERGGGGDRDVVALTPLHSIPP